MGMVVRTNTMAMNAQRQLGMNNNAVSKSLEKLSSGFRINRAADDASGLAISEKMKAQIKGLEQASSNSQDGISLIQTAEGATTEIHNMLNRMVELATKSANGTIQNEVDREAIQREVDDLNTEITRIAKSTNFNGINLLDGSLGGATVKNNVTPPTGGGTTPPVTTTVGSMGDGTTPASFSIAISDDVLKNGGKLVIGDQTFNMAGDIATTAAAEHTVDIDGLDKDAALSALKDKINTVFGASGSEQIGGQSFTATISDGKIVMTATANAALVDGDGNAMTEDDLISSITATAGTTTTDPVVPDGAVGAGKNATAGSAAKAEKAVYTFDAPALGDTVKVGGDTFTFATSTGANDLTMADTSDAEVKKALEALGGKIATSGYTAAAAKNSEGKWELTLTADSTGDQTDLEAVTVGSSETITPTTNDTTKVSAYEFSGAPAAGDKVTVGGKTYTFVASDTESPGANDIKMSNDADPVAAAKANLEALGAKIDSTSKYDTITATEADGVYTLTMTPTSASDVPDLSAGISYTKASSAEPVVTNGDDGTAGHVDFDIKFGDLKEGDILNVNGKKILVSFEADTPAGDNDAVLDLSGDQSAADFFKTKMNAALTTAGAGFTVSGAVKDETTDTTYTMTFTQNAAADKTTTELNSLVTVTAKNAGGSGGSGSSANVPATPGFGPAVAAAGPAPAAAAPGTGAPKSSLSFTSQPNVGATMTIGEGANAKTFEFVKKGDAANVTAGNIAVEVGDTLGDTMDNLATVFGANAVADIGIARDQDITDPANPKNLNSFTITNNKTGATAKDFASVQLKGMGLKLQVGDTNDDFNHVSVSVDDLTAEGLGTAGLNVSNQDAAGDAIAVIKKAINQVSTNRANLGSLQNRLEYTINNLDTTAENMTSANSRIRDTDMAKEMMNYTKMNVLTQAAQAMLAQANQQPQSILQLLQ